MPPARKTALITGASAGLGKEYASIFAAASHDLVLVARRRDRLETIATALENEHDIKARVIPADLSEPDSPREIFAALQAAGVEIDVLVNNAGFGSTGRFSDAELGRELAMVQVNIVALIHLTHLLLPGMLARNSGRILNIGSTAGFQPGPYMANYYATKAYVNHFTEALAVELAGTRVTATVSCPGPTLTEFGHISGNEANLLFKRGGASARDVAEHGYRAMMRSQVVAVHGLSNQLVVQALRLGPRRLIRHIAARLNLPG